VDLNRAVDPTRVPIAVASELYERMALIREFEQRVMKVFLRGLISGTIHLSIGQEACAVGATAPLRRDDWITITHRGHGQAIAKGVEPRRLMAELLGRETGCCRGFGGSMHVGDVSVGALPGSAIVGAGVPIAAGLAFASKYRGEDRVVLCFFGEGAVTEGDAHEGFNLAALWELPVIYLCENNQYAISTPLDRQMKTTRVSDWAQGYGMPGVTIDGNDVIAVYETVSEAVKSARSGGGPTFIECLTYRQGGHKRDDPATYRPPAEVELWLARDPLLRLRQGLEAVGEGEAVERAHARAVEAIDEAVEFAEASPYAGGAAVHEHVQVEVAHDGGTA
jgi:TPP-dependent pyruvate/acetoin dehydrogenase alpha subunit